MFYIQQDEKIVLFDENLERLQNTIAIMPQYEGLEILETEREIIELNNEFVFKDEVEAELAEKERERVNGLKCTKRVFALMLQQMGVDYLTMLKPLIESNPQAQLEWELCVELERGNPLLDVMAEQLNVSSDKLDALFKLANNEITQEEFIQAITPQEEAEDEIQEEAEEIEEEVEEVVE